MAIAIELCHEISGVIIAWRVPIIPTFEAVIVELSNLALPILNPVSYKSRLPRAARDIVVPCRQSMRVLLRQISYPLSPLIPPFGSVLLMRNWRLRLERSQRLYPKQLPHVCL